jgi:hypothetical protein
VSNRSFSAGGNQQRWDPAQSTGSEYALRDLVCRQRLASLTAGMAIDDGCAMRFSRYVATAAADKEDERFQPAALSGSHASCSKRTWVLAKLRA